MFAADWPFENIDHAADWFGSIPISEADRIKMGRSNVIDLFGLGLN
jgi:2,3-dihydroxybenzoate decarboxylase